MRNNNFFHSSGNLTKKLLLSGLTIVSISTGFSQGNNWRLDGNNNGSNSTFLGTTTNQPLVFKTNNAERFRINGAGQFTFTGFGAGSGFLCLEANGLLTKTLYTGNANQVLLGNGTFGTVPGLTNYFTQYSSTQLNTTYKLGIGVLQPQQMLEVNGNGVFNGTVTAQGINITEVGYAGKTLFFKPTGMCMDGYDLATNTLNEICGITQPLYINSKAGLSQNTILNFGNTSAVGIGTANPQGKLDVDGKSYFRQNVFFTNIVLDTVIDTLGTFMYRKPTGEVVSISLEKAGEFFGAIAKPKPCDVPFQNFLQTPTWQYGPGKAFVNSSDCLPNPFVGIGTANPTANLHIKNAGANAIYIENPIGTKIYYINSEGDVFAKKSMAINAEPIAFAQLYLNNNEKSTAIQINQTANNINFQKFVYAEYTNANTEFFKFQNTESNYTAFLMQANGSFYINNGTQKILQLDSDGLLKARKIKLDVESWPDYVFNNDYNLLSIDSVETYIKQNGHLPNVPSEKEVLQNGIEVQETTEILLKKIEELTLYLIQQEKRIKELEQIIQR